MIYYVDVRLVQEEDSERRVSIYRCGNGFHVIEERQLALTPSSDKMALISIRISDNKLEIVNQLLLPHVTEFVQIDTIEQAHDAIKTMKVGLLLTQISLLFSLTCR
jgi:hypothetical protein